MRHALLKSVFGHDAFHPGQEELIDALSSGRDLLGVMATGSGKSLCYQFPAVELGKCCLVVSPLISLMNDQVKKLELAGVPAAGMHSNLSFQERQRAMEMGGSICDFFTLRRNDFLMKVFWRRSPPADRIMSSSTRHIVFRSGGTIFDPNTAAWAGSRNCSRSRSLLSLLRRLHVFKERLSPI